MASRCYPAPSANISDLPNTNLNSCRINLIIAVTAENVKTLTNVPITDAGILRITVAGAYCSQEYFTGTGAWHRFYGSGGWETWVKH